MDALYPGWRLENRVATRHGYEKADPGSKAERDEGAVGGEAEADDRQPPGVDAACARSAGGEGRQRHGEAGRNLADRNREQIYEVARKMGIPGRSKMGKWELIDAIRKAR
jgi:Rho termination factor-like protein